MDTCRSSEKVRHQALASIPRSSLRVRCCLDQVLSRSRTPCRFPLNDRSGFSTGRRQRSRYNRRADIREALVRPLSPLDVVPRLWPSLKAVSKSLHLVVNAFPLVTPSAPSSPPDRLLTVFGLVRCPAGTSSRHILPRHIASSALDVWRVGPFGIVIWR